MRLITGETGGEEMDMTILHIPFNSSVNPKLLEKKIKSINLKKFSIFKKLLSKDVLKEKRSVESQKHHLLRNLY